MLFYSAVATVNETTDHRTTRSSDEENRRRSSTSLRLDYANRSQSRFQSRPIRSEHRHVDRRSRNDRNPCASDPSARDQVSKWTRWFQRSGGKNQHRKVNDEGENFIRTTFEFRLGGIWEIASWPNERSTVGRVFSFHRKNQRNIRCHSPVDSSTNSVWWEIDRNDIFCFESRRFRKLINTEFIFRRCRRCTRNRRHRTESSNRWKSWNRWIIKLCFSFSTPFQKTSTNRSNIWEIRNWVLSLSEAHWPMSPHLHLVSFADALIS